MRSLTCLLCAILLAGCAAAPSPEAPNTFAPEIAPTQTAVARSSEATQLPAPNPLQSLLESMTVEERVGQLFLARCDAETAVSDIETLHLAGFILFSKDFQNQTPDSISQTLSSYQSTAKIPLLLAVDEEGGSVTRISSHRAFRSKPFPSPRDTFRTGGLDAVLEVEEEKYKLLSELGINVNMGPVCDIADDPNAFLYARSLGQDSFVTAEFVSRTVRLARAYRVGSVLKHFPGYGNNSDTHTGIATDHRSLEAFWEKDLIPFSGGISAGANCVLVSHTIVEAFDSTLPASLSPEVHAFLRDSLGFQGVILTDDLVMEAITDQFGAGEAAVLAVLAGNDLLCSTEYATQYQAVLEAVQSGRIGSDTLDTAVLRVLQWKQDLGLIE